MDAVMKTREQRLKELKQVMSVVEPATSQAENVPFLKLANNGQVDGQGMITLHIDALALTDGLHISSTKKSKVNFDTVTIAGIGRLNVTAIQKL